jgi:hypothetical protein
MGKVELQLASVQIDLVCLPEGHRPSVHLFIHPRHAIFVLHLSASLYR